MFVYVRVMIESMERVEFPMIIELYETISEGNMYATFYSTIRLTKNREEL